MQAASSLNQSHVQLHAYISYKAIKILALRWVGTRLLMYIDCEDSNIPELQKCSPETVIDMV